MIHNVAIKYGFGDKDIEEYGLDKYIYKSEVNEKFDEKFEKKIKELFTEII